MKHVIKIFVVSMCSVVLLSLWTPKASAHTLKVDGTIGATLHIDPNDQPVSGKTANIIITIEDSAHKYDPNNPQSCNCNLTISDQKSTLITLPLAASNGYSQLHYTFPHSGSYSLKVSGQPVGEANFQNFNMTFSTYVSTGADNIGAGASANMLQTYYPVIAILSFGAIIVLIVYYSEGDKK